MGYTLEQFSEECHRILAEDPGVEGRRRVCALVQDVLKDEDFVATHLHDRVPERKILYEDPELGFCILGHVNHGARVSPPHDHGPTWAIYGQARGKTIMSDWEMLEPASEDKVGKVRLVREYALSPGDAYIYNEGDLHSPRRESSTRLIRIEGTNVEKIRRFPYEAA
jgi:predicted metal-dependent enzyme (double-stranded beta helix superfamily)